MKSTIFVLEPADTYNLITLDDALLELQISNPTDNDKALIEKHIAGVSVAIAKYCDRVFPAEKVEETLWEPSSMFGPISHNHYRRFHSGIYTQFRSYGSGIESLYLKRYPILSIDSVYVDDVALTSDSNDLSLRTDYDNGVLYNLSNGYPSTWCFSKAIVATYTGGYETIPEDLQRVAIRWVEMAWFAAGQDITVKSENVYGIANVTYATNLGATSNNVTSDVPDEIKLLLEPYIRQWSFA